MLARKCDGLTVFLPEKSKRRMFLEFQEWNELDFLPDNLCRYAVGIVLEREVEKFCLRIPLRLRGDGCRYLFRLVGHVDTHHIVGCRWTFGGE